MIHLLRAMLLTTVVVLPGCTTAEMWGGISDPKPHVDREQVIESRVRIQIGSQPDVLRVVWGASDRGAHDWRLKPVRGTEVARALMVRPALFILQRADLDGTIVTDQSSVLEHEAKLSLRGRVAFEGCRVPLGQLVPARFSVVTGEAPLDQVLKRARAESFSPKRLVRLPEALRDCACGLLETKLDGERVSAFAFVNSDRKLSPSAAMGGSSELTRQLSGLRPFDVVVRFGQSLDLHRLRCDWLFLADQVGGFGLQVSHSIWQLDPVAADTESRSLLCDASLKLTKVWLRPGAGWDMPGWQKVLTTPFTLATDSVYLPCVLAGIGVIGLVVWAEHYSAKR
ncbi:MAG: hypothetical protein ACI91B_003368 [Planctomycetota bacterium]|jgi:hypothetical protein